MKLKISISLILIVLFYNLPSYSKEDYKNKRIAVLDFTATNIDRAYAKAVRNKIEIALFKTNLHILERKSLSRVLFEMGRSKPCSNDACARRQGKMVSADYVVVGDVTFAGKYIITSRVVDVRTGRIVFADSVICKDRENILKKTDRLAKELSGSVEKPNPTKRTGKTTFRFTFFLKGGYSQPVLYLAKKSKLGYNISFTPGLSINNYFLGLKTGLNHMYNHSSHNYADIVPMMLNLKYIFDIRGFIIGPSLSFGIAYNYLTALNTSAIEPIVNAGLNIGYRFKSKYSIFAFTDYYCIIEKNRGVQFLNFGIGVGVSI